MGYSGYRGAAGEMVLGNFDRFADDGSGGAPPPTITPTHPGFFIGEYEEPRYWFDFRNTSTLFSDTGKTTLATPGGPVAAATRQFGDGSVYFFQPDITKRPLLQDVVAGVPSLKMDGLDDVMLLAGALSATADFTVLMACQVIGGPESNNYAFARNAGKDTPDGYGIGYYTPIPGVYGGDISDVGINVVIEDAETLAPPKSVILGISVSAAGGPGATLFTVTNASTGVRTESSYSPAPISTLLGVPNRIGADNSGSNHIEMYATGIFAIGRRLTDNEHRGCAVWMSQNMFSPIAL